MRVGDWTFSHWNINGPAGGDRVEIDVLRLEFLHKSFNQVRLSGLGGPLTFPLGWDPTVGVVSLIEEVCSPIRELLLVSGPSIPLSLPTRLVFLVAHVSGSTSFSHHCSLLPRSVKKTKPPSWYQTWTE